MVIDFHSHILPNVDDGSKSVEMSLEMLRREARQGIKTVVLTPHFYANHDSPAKFSERCNRAEAKLREAMKNCSDLPELVVGSEVHFFEGISDCEFLNQMAIAGTNCVLVEMPMRAWSERMLVELEGIRQKRKLIPIIAHIDRYMGVFKDNGIPDKLSELPVYSQVNANFFINRWSRRLALRLLAQDKIHLLGSDCHDLKERIPNLGMALEVIKSSLGESAVERINYYENKLIAKK